MARLASDTVAQLEAELEATMEEVTRLETLASKLEDDLDAKQNQIYELDEEVFKLAEFREFVEQHFPDAVQAFEVRNRMEAASGN